MGKTTFFLLITVEINFLSGWSCSETNNLQKIWNASRICVSSLRRGHANLLCIVPILVYVLPKQVQFTEVIHPYKYSSSIISANFWCDAKFCNIDYQNVSIGNDTHYFYYTSSEVSSGHFNSVIAK